MSEPASIRFLRLPDVLDATGLSRSGLYRCIRDGGFPPARPYRDRRGSFWTSVEVQRWQAQQVGEDEWTALIG